MSKMKIKVHESEETLLDSFENLANLCAVVDGELSNKSAYSYLKDVADIQKGVGVDMLGTTPADLKTIMLKKQKNLNAAFDNFLGKLDAYL